MQFQGGNQSGDSGFRSLDVRRQAEIAQRARGDGADGGADDGGRQGEAGSFQQSDQVGSRGGAGEGDGVGAVAGIAEEGSDGLERRRRDAVAVGRGDGDLAAGGFEAVAEDGGGCLREHQEEALAGRLRAQGFGERLGGESGRNDAGLEANDLDRARSGWADDSDPAGPRIESKHDAKDRKSTRLNSSHANI